jgi:2,3-bisphosphoglycerate-dependent phosphoglycerate mutase
MRGLFFGIYFTTIDMDEKNTKGGAYMAEKWKQLKPWLGYMAIGLVAAALFLAWFLWHSSPMSTVFLVRHAEKAVNPAGNPALTDAGIERADMLSRLLSGAGITAIYSTPFSRTRQTAMPLADLLQLPVFEYDAMDFQGLVDRIRMDHSGKTVLVVGHSNTVPRIIEAFGAEPVSPISDDEYDNLFGLTLVKNKSRVFIIKFGQSGQDKSRAYKMQLDR